MEITTVLGVTKQVEKHFEDGSYICPFCGYPTRDECRNPVCEAAPHWKKAELENFLAIQKRNKERDEEFQKNFRRLYGGQR